MPSDKSKKLKGKLLEYFIKRILLQAGFTPVEKDDLFIFESRGLFFINGKGAAHDADVLMEPPIQIPFIYPIRLLFECKAYSTKIGLNTVRGAYGLREDLNNFELLTRETLMNRKANVWNDFSNIEAKRHIYQIGVASLKEFTYPAISFAANYKIPLFSLNWLNIPNVLRNFDLINNVVVESIINDYDDFIKYLRSNDKNADEIFRSIVNRVCQNEIIGDLMTFINATIKLVYVGVIETGDIIFLYNSGQRNVFNENRHEFQTKIHWEYSEIYDSNVFTIDIENEDNVKYEFLLPRILALNWRKTQYDKKEAIRIKSEYLSKIFVFKKQTDNTLPMYILKINDEWLNEARERLR